MNDIATKCSMNTCRANIIRHNHIPINLKLKDKENNKWIQIKAMGWNSSGFNFYSENDICGNIVIFKRGLFQFNGEVVWHSEIPNYESIPSSTINELIFRQANKIKLNSESYKRLINLLRTPGIISGKLNFLRSLGYNISDAMFEKIIDQKLLEEPKFHYGVKVNSENWSQFVKKALEFTSAIEALEKFSDALVAKKMHT